VTPFGGDPGSSSQSDPVRNIGSATGDAAFERTSISIAGFIIAIVVAFSMFALRGIRNRTIDL
jgi:hypothetical protein